MVTYTIDVSPNAVSREYEVLLRGPGLNPDGRRYVFAHTERCRAFVEAVNFAYRQGLLDASVKTDSDPLLVVTGTTPENLAVRPESRFARLKRQLRMFVRERRLARASLDK